MRIYFLEIVLNASTGSEEGLVKSVCLVWVVSVSAVILHLSVSSSHFLVQRMRSVWRLSH